jgi:hypothetical protein
MTIKTRFSLGDILYLKTDLDQLPRMVIYIKILGDPNCVIYGMVAGDEMSEHFDMELSEDKIIF